MDARYLRPGDLLLTHADGLQPVTETSLSFGQTTVYNIEVNAVGTYGVGPNGILVHNKPMQIKEIPFKEAPESAPKLLNPPIEVTPGGMQHVLDRHTVNNIAKYVGKSKFNPGEDIAKLIEQATQQPMVPQANGNFARTFDVGRSIGVDRATGQATSTMTVITRPNGTLVTAFPGKP